MSRYIQDIVLNKPDDFVNFMMSDFIHKYDFFLHNWKGETCYRSGDAFMAGYRYFTWGYRNGVLHLEAWLRGPFGTEMGLTGFYGGVQKRGGRDHTAIAAAPARRRHAPLGHVRGKRAHARYFHERGFHKRRPCERCPHERHSRSGSHPGTRHRHFQACGTGAGTGHSLHRALSAGSLFGDPAVYLRLYIQQEIHPFHQRQDGYRRFRVLHHRRGAGVRAYLPELFPRADVRAPEAFSFFSPEAFSFFS